MCRQNRIRIGPPAPGIERLEARLFGQAYAPHRHDTYAIGITLAGVQTFRYRGERWHCLPGEIHVLHPDELHDGGAGTADGFRYRIVYVDPALVRAASGGRGLPFLARPVLGAAPRARCDIDTLWDIDADHDETASVDLLTTVTDLLTGARPGDQPTPGALATEALARVREAIAARPADRLAMARLERIAGLDRWTLARQFRSLYGTSPSRFRTLRQLDQARRLLQGGATLVEAAVAAGFADQSHMTRQFKRAYGLTPGAWVAAIYGNRLR